MQLQPVELSSLSIDRFAPLIGDEAMERAHAAAIGVRNLLDGRVFWNVNSTAVGGGVAEMLRPLLRYTRGVGIDTRWLVIQGNPGFFQVTKRLHHALHGSTGNGSALGEAERAIYEETLKENAREICASVRSGDFVLLHDPQTAGLVPSLLRAGARVIWRCHIGHDRVNDEVRRGWAFLAPYLEGADAYVFSRAEYRPDLLDRSKVAVIRPSIDPFSSKNRDLDEQTIRTVLVHNGLIEGPLPPSARPDFERDDGGPGRLDHQADIVRMGRAPTWDTPLVTQVSRWDGLKDPIGVMQGFATLINGSAPADAHLILAGPNVTAVSDDPEGAGVLSATIDAWRRLPHGVRRRIHLACLPMADPEENALIVNALQRHAQVVVQKSLHEGFGLTVTEAMWKSRAVLASAVGGIRDQIEDGISGVLLDDPTDPDAFATALRGLLENPDYRKGLGQAAHERVREHFLGVRQLLEYGELIGRISDPA